MRLPHRVADLFIAGPLLAASPFLYLAGRYRWSLRLSRRIQDAAGVTIVRNHYYEPVYTSDNLSEPSDRVRELPGVDFNLEGQRTLLDRLHYAQELASLDGSRVGNETYRYVSLHTQFGAGDADALYSLIRAFKPRNVVEIGCGQSSIVAQLALRKNRSEDPAYEARHVCIEPYHNGWLNDLGPDVRRERVETIGLDIFKAMGPNDILFIDSTHVVRPQGDVEHEFLRILPVLPPGVLVHIHDIFTPRDYNQSFQHEDRRFWTEQYMLEAFLSFNPHYEVLLALNDLHKRREPKLYDAFPILAERPDSEPGSFWIRRKILN